MLAGMLGLSRKDVIRRVQGMSEVPAMVRLGITGGLAVLSDDEFNMWRYWVSEAIGALGESERGRKVLGQIGITSEPARNENAEPAGAPAETGA